MWSLFVGVASVVPCVCVLVVLVFCGLSFAWWGFLLSFLVGLVVFSLFERVCISKLQFHQYNSPF